MEIKRGRVFDPQTRLHVKDEVTNCPVKGLPGDTRGGQMEGLLGPLKDQARVGKGWVLGRQGGFASLAGTKKLKWGKRIGGQGRARKDT